MKKMGKRFMALFIVFMSIMSFLPVQFGLNGQAANALDSSATDIQVAGDGTPEGTVDSSKKPIYSTPNQSAYFTMTVKDLRVNPASITQLDKPAIIDQEVIITSINRIRLDNPDTKDDNLKILNDMGLTLGISTDNGRIGAKINGLPLGVNEITYTVKVTERTLVLVNPNDPNDKSTKTIDNVTQNDDKTINIEHGNTFVQSQIKYIDFIDYIGGRPGNPDTTLENNKTPFQYLQRMESEQGKTLRFTHDIPNSVTDMDYKISMPAAVDLNGGDLVRINGGLSDANTGVDSENNPILIGSLKKTATSTIIVIAIRHSGAIQNTYSIEIKYNNKVAENDYSLKNAGITKLNYNVDADVKAYIGKQFTTKIENGVLTYLGTINVDKNAEMISMEPTIGRSSANTAFKISNHYDGGIQDSILLNGKQYVNFAKGTGNEIWLEIYEGKDGNVTGSLLAIYKLKVNLIGTTDSTVDFSFPSPTILTQPGRTKNEPISFNSDRRTYELYSDSNDIPVNLVSPNTSHHEYIRAWGGTSLQSDNVTELPADTSRNRIINVSSYKKLVLQAYYDEIVYAKNPDGTDDTSKVESRTPYPIGQKYTFYIHNNMGTPDDGGSTSSSDASLIDITVDNGNIKATDGTVGFSTDKTNYMVTVPKIDISSKITVTASNKDVKDITAKIAETGDEYGLTTQVPFNFPLNSTGKTNITIIVTAQDGITKKTYNIAVNNDTRGASALLKNVITDNGDFTFDPEKDPNKIRVDQAINKLKVSPVPVEAKSRVTVNGQNYTGNPITIDLKGSQETDMEITVTSEDGSDSKTYNFEIYRTDTPIDSGDDDNDEGDIFYDDIDECWVDTSKYEEWGTIKGKTMYFDKKGRQVKDRWINTKGTWYYVDSKGYKSSGWRKDVGGKSYYLDPTTGEMRKGWMNQNNKWYYLGLNGVMQKGWLYLNGKWYYFTPEGEMMINQSMYIDGQIYSFGSDGVASY